MGKKFIQHGILLSMVIVSSYGCFPSKKVVTGSPANLTAKEIDTPTKVFLRDSSVVIFNEGFTIEEQNLTGVGERYWLDLPMKSGEQRVDLDSIATLSYYQKESDKSTIFGSTIMGYSAAIVTPLSIYCLTCPKCCFGSCPTVYTTDGTKYGLEAELFSYSLSKYYQETDIDRLIQGAKTDGPFRMRLTNEALETHYINQLSLLAVRHPANTEIYPTPEGEFISVKKLETPETVINSLGEDVRHLVEKKDTEWHFGDSTRIKRVKSADERDWMDVSLQLSEGARDVKLVLRLRNTLLTTVLFYDVVLASQGVAAIEWTERLNTDPLYSSMYHLAYNTFAGMDFSVLRDGEWVKAGRLGDVGPIAWKEVAVVLPVVADHENRMRVRLEWFPDNFMIDYIAYDVPAENHDIQVESEIIHPRLITDFLDEDVSDIYVRINKDDADFLVTEPGDFYDFEYDIPHREEVSTTLFIKSKGYYTEWLRGEWIGYGRDDYQFNLFEANKTLEQLKKSWEENRTLLEKTFFETKIPLKEGL